MKEILYILLILTTSFQSSDHQRNCFKHSNSVTSGIESLTNQDIQKLLNSEGQIVETRILCPSGYKRVDIQKNSFAEYLRKLPLKPHNSQVEYYDGTTKSNHDVYDAVVDLRIGNKDLHQCADAIMRLRAEFLWNGKQYSKIHFNFTNGFRVDYTEWMKGKRIVVKGNSAYWTPSGKPSNTYNDFWKYMETIFSYAGTLSLSKELNSVKINDLQIGDIFIKGGSPGHAVIVVDMATDPGNNKKIFILAQSYMPAQEIQILKNPNNNDISPWYSADFGQILETPEWTFKTTELMRFEE